MKSASLPEITRLCLFGGSFDPVHCGHLAIAVAAVAALDLQRVIFLPAARSPHKHAGPQATSVDRLRMLALATAELDWAEISEFDLHRSPAYSADTLEHFSQLHLRSELHWLLGADQWAVIEKWSRPEVLARLAHFLVFPRGEIPILPHPGFRFTVINVRHPASATQVRELAAQGASLDGHVPASVAEYILKHQLYR